MQQSKPEAKAKAKALLREPLKHSQARVIQGALTELIKREAAHTAAARVAAAHVQLEGGSAHSSVEDGSVQEKENLCNES